LGLYIVIVIELLFKCSYLIVMINIDSFLLLLENGSLLELVESGSLQLL